MKSSTEILTPNLKKHLPHNFRKIISSAFNNNYSESYISKVVSGKRNNTDIMAAAVALARKHRETEINIINQIKILDNEE